MAITCNLAVPMRYLCIFLLIAVPGVLKAQRLTGLLLGEENRTPLAHATITAGANTAQSNASGVFTLNIPPQTDSARIVCAGYARYAFKPKFNLKKDTQVIYLQLIIYNLKEVKIKSIRDFKADSLRTRNDFAGVFKHKGTSFSDVFPAVDINKKAYEDYITTRNITTQLVTVDVLQVISLLSKKKDKTSKLQQVLLKEEAENYVDSRFSKDVVKAVTGLKNDSLQVFMQRYRPTKNQLITLSDYGLVSYIKESYSEYKGGKVKG